MLQSHSRLISHLCSIQPFFRRLYFGYIQGHDYFDDNQIKSIKTYIGRRDERVIEQFESNFASLVGEGKAISFASGRMGFFSLLKILDIGDGDEVILNGATCSVMANAVLRSTAKPVYSDIDPETFGSSPEQIKQCLTSKTKIIVAQHSFGIPCKILSLIHISEPTRP